MDTYEKSVQGVDKALERLNATLNSYKLAATTKPTESISAAPARKPASVPTVTAFQTTCGAPAKKSAHGGLQANGHSAAADRSVEPQAPSGSSTDLLVELPQDSQDEIWQEVLALRFWNVSDDGNRAPELPAMLGDLVAIDRHLDAIRRIQEHYFTEYPYLLPLRIVAAQKYLQLGYPDLASGEAYKALMLCDAIRDSSDDYHRSATSQLHEFIQQIPLVERIRLLKGEIHDAKAPPPREPDDDIDVEVDVWIREHYKSWAYRLLALGLLRCGCLKSARFYADQGRGSLLESGIEYLDDQWLLDVIAVTQAAAAKHLGLSEEEAGRSKHLDDYPDSGLVRREVYPWNKWEPNRLEELSDLNTLLSEVAPKLEVRAVELPDLTGNGGGETVMQLGVFAKEDIAPGEIVLRETSMLTANNRLQDALCDACGADLPGLGSAGADDVCGCPDCEAVFCSETCLSRAEETYHRPLCNADLDALLRDVPPAEAADALYTLLLQRAIAMAEVQECHPLELNEVKYIWGDFHNLPFTSTRFQPPDLSSRGRLSSISAHGNFPCTLPWSFEHNIRLPLEMLEKMEIDPYAEPNFDLWVFTTLFAKFRGTASARLSGQMGGRKARGPEVSAVHPMWCLANHSCDPNVSWEWGGSIQFEVRKDRVAWRGKHGEWRSKAGLEEGEEVLNHYCDVDLPVKERREWARGALGGDCMCRRCVWEAEQEVST